jgi:hypothetical protein
MLATYLKKRDEKLIEKGREEGIEKGIEKGREEGREEGIEKAQCVLANHCVYPATFNHGSRQFTFQLLEFLFTETCGKDVLFHSRFYPEKEARKTLVQYMENDPDTILLGGFGLGYYLEKAIELFSDIPIIVIEKDLGILKIALTERYLVKTLKNKNVHLIVSDDHQVLITLLKSLKKNKISIALHEPSSKLYPEFYKKLRKVVTDYTNAKEINFATLKKFHKLWTKKKYNKPVKQKLYDATKDKLVRIIYLKYNKKGKKIKSIIKDKNNNLIEYIKYRYNKLGKLAAIELYGNKKNLMMFSIYQYDTAGDLLLKKAFIIENGKTYPYSTTKFQNRAPSISEFLDE